jgi:hypothetical protein
MGLKLQTMLTRVERCQAIGLGLDIWGRSLLLQRMLVWGSKEFADSQPIKRTFGFLNIIIVF